MVLTNVAGSVTSSVALFGVFSQAGPAYAFTNFVGQPGVEGFGDGTGSNAWFYYPSGVAVDSAGNVYVADGQNDTIRKVTPAGVVTTLAGSPGQYGIIDGTGSNARFKGPSGVAVDSAGNVYVADYGNHAIRKVTPAGVVTTLPAVSPFPQGVAVDSASNVYVADPWRILELSPAGVVTTLAGSVSSWGTNDGVGSAARFTNPEGVAVDSADNVYVADYGNNAIRKVTPAGVVTTLASLGGPYGVAVDSAGNVYVATYGNETIQKVTPAGVVTTLAGSPLQIGSSDGTGSNARFYKPQGVAVDSAGNLYVADTYNNRISKGTPILSPSPVIVTQPVGATSLCGSTVSLAATAVGVEPIGYQWCLGGSPISGATSSTYSFTLTPATAGNYTVVVTNSYGAATSFAVVNMADTNSPVITMLGANPLTNECHSAFVDPGATANDSCAGAVTPTTNNPVNPNAVGVYTITYVATDPSGNSASNTRTVYVVDTTPPVITLNGTDPMTIECYSTFTDPGATASDTCAGSVPVSVSGMVNANSPGTYTLTYSATDPSGNNATNTRTVYVAAPVPPVVTWSFTNLTLSADTNCQALMPDVTGTNYILATNAYSSVLTITQTPATNAVLSLGTNEVMLAVADGNGNVAYCTNTVVVADTTAPVITQCAPPQTVTAGNNGLATVPDLTALVVASDACSASVNITQQPAAGTSLNVGDYTVVLSVDDGNGNTNTCSTPVTVYPPIAVACPSNITTTATSSSGTVVFFNVTASGGCSPLSLTHDPPSGSTFPIGTNLVSCTASDGCGGTNNCSFLVSVIGPPITLTCSSNLTVTATSSNGAVVFFTNTVSGGCSSPSLTNYPPSGSTFPIGTNFVTCTASDACGTTVNSSFLVNVIVSPINLSCPGNMTVTATSGDGAVVFYTATAASDCSPVWLTCNPPSGSTFPVGTTTVTCTASDCCGTSTNCCFLVTVLKPTLNVSISVNGRSGTVTITWAGNGTLQRANSLYGPWTDLPSATSPYVENAASSAKFYRSRTP